METAQDPSKIVQPAAPSRLAALTIQLKSAISLCTHADSATLSLLLPALDEFRDVVAGELERRCGRPPFIETRDRELALWLAQRRRAREAAEGGKCPPRPDSTRSGG